MKPVEKITNNSKSSYPRSPNVINGVRIPGSGNEDIQRPLERTYAYGTIETSVDGNAGQ